MSSQLFLRLFLGAVFVAASSDRAIAQSPLAPDAAASSPSPPATPSTNTPAVAPTPRHGHFHHGHHDHARWQRCRDCLPEPARADFMPALFVGAGMFELSGLNARLDAAGYERLDAISPVIGGELRVIHPSGLLTGIYGAAILPTTGTGPDGVRSSWNGGFGLLDAGWAFVHLPGFTLSLSGGVGGYWASLDIHRRGDVDFADVLANPRRGTSLGVGGLLFGAVLRADGRIPLGAPRRDRQSYLALGLRVSGLWGPALGGWDFNEYNNDVDEGPSGNLAGVYAALVIGWGGMSISPAP